MQTVAAGKFRRYHHLSIVQHLITPSIVLLNMRDIVLIATGFLQTLVRLVLWRPDVVFAKGGFVCLPVGYAAWLLGIPLVLHDSDVVPGLTNRLLAKKATFIATGAPLSNYPYDRTITSYVGIPIAREFTPHTIDAQRRAKKALGFSDTRPLTVVIGGGLGAKSLNDAIAAQYETLLKSTNIFLLSGKAQYAELVRKLPDDTSHIQVHEFVSGGIAGILGAADIVVSRAGATALLELAALEKPTIVVPSSNLTWQVKHAQMFADQGAVLCLDELKFLAGDYSELIGAIDDVLANSSVQKRLSGSIAKMAMPDAAAHVADMIRQAVK